MGDSIYWWKVCGGGGGRLAGIEAANELTLQN